MVWLKEKEGRMETEAVIDAVRDFLDDSGYRYEYNAERQFLQLGFKIDCKLKNTHVIIDFTKLGFVVYTVPSLGVDKESIPEMMKFLTMANYGLLNGNFELDVIDGEIRFKCWVGTWNIDNISGAMVDEALSVALFMMERYGNGIAAIAMGFSDAETEMAKLQKDASDQSEDEGS